LSWLRAHAQSNKNWLIQYAAVHELCRSWKDDSEILLWLKTYDEWDCHPNVKEQAVIGLASIMRDDPNTLIWLKSKILSHSIWAIRRAGICSLAKFWKDDSETMSILKKSAQADKNDSVRFKAIRLLAKGWKIDSMFEFLATLAISDPFERRSESQYNPREAAIKALLTHHPSHYAQTLELLSDRAINDPDEQLRQWAQEQLKMYPYRGYR